MIFINMKDLRLFIESIVRRILDEQQEIGAKLNDNFWRWFGNSKIVGGGKPLVCYHGSDQKGIKSFDLGKIGYGSGNYGHYGYGIYFSTDIRESRTYGSIIYECYIRMSRPFTGTDEQILELKNSGVGGIDDLVVLSIDFDSFKNSFKRGSYIYKFIDSIEKKGLEKTWDDIREMGDTGMDLDLLNDIGEVIGYTTLNKNVEGVPDYVFDFLKKKNIRPKMNKGFYYDQSLHWITDLGNRSKEVTEVIKKLGYDGVWYGSEIVVFDPVQIKSIHNDGSWDKNDRDIYS
jgi:hypothetical protein